MKTSLQSAIIAAAEIAEFASWQAVTTERIAERLGVCKMTVIRMGPASELKEQAREFVREQKIHYPRAYLEAFSRYLPRHIVNDIVGGAGALPKGVVLCRSDRKIYEIGGELPPIDIIAHHLAYANRFNGAFGHYSVAQHCVLASSLIEDDDLRLAALLHDAPEAIYGDISSPIKKVIASPGLEALETYYHDLVDQTFGVDTRHPKVVECDLRMVVTEAKFFGAPLEHFPKVEPYPTVIGIAPWPAEEAKATFIMCFNKLSGRKA